MHRSAHRRGLKRRPWLRIRSALALVAAGVLATLRPNTAGASTRPDALVPQASTQLLDADIEVQKLGPGGINPGDTIVYSIRVTNRGPAAASGVSISDILPAQGTFLSASNSGAFAAGIVTWPAIAMLPANASVTYTVRFAAPVCPTVITNVAAATAASPNDPVPNNNTSARSTRIEGRACPADIEVLKTGPASATTGDTIVYSVRITNRGPGPASGVRLTDALPVDGQFAGASHGGTANNGIVSWPTIASMAPNATATYTVRFVAPACPTTITNVATAAATSPSDPAQSNNTSSVVTRVDGNDCLADLEVVKTGPARAVAGDTIVYSIDVRNRGPAVAAGVVVRDVLPGAGTFLDASDAGAMAGGVVTWPSIASMSPSDTARFTVRILAPAGPATLSDRAIVSSASPPDPNPANDTSSVTTVIGSVAITPDLEVVKTGPAQASASDTIVYTIRVRNLESVAMRGVVVTDVLPADGVYLGASGGGSAAGGVVTWPSIAVLGALDSVAYSVRWLAPACGDTLTNVARVGASSPVELNIANNTSVVTTHVVGRSCEELNDPDLRIVKEGVGSFQAGSTGKFRFTVTNAGLAATRDPITVTDRLPAGLEFVSGGGIGWVVSSAGPDVTAVFGGTLAAGGSTSFEITVRVGDAAVPRVCNTAVAETAGDPADDPDNTSTICVAVAVNDSELRIEKRASNSEVEIGGVVDYELVVSVVGTGVLTDVVVTDTLPLGFRYVAGSAHANGDPVYPDGVGGPVLVFRLGTLAPGTVTIRYRLLVGPGAIGGDGINRVRVAGGGKTSNQGRARVRVRSRAFTDEGMIAGKVFLDSTTWVARRGGCGCDWVSDRAQGWNEPGIPGVRVLLQDGTSAITDGEGKYLFSGLSPRTWVVNVDRSTLPSGARLIPLTNRHAGDGSSVLVDLKRGELFRADFAEGSASDIVGADVFRRRSAIDSTAAVLEDSLYSNVVASGTPRLGLPRPEFMPVLSGVAADAMDRRIREVVTGLDPFRRAPPSDTSSLRPVLNAGAGIRPAAVTADTAPRPVVAIGLLEARLEWSLTDRRLGMVRTRDRFEDELRSVRRESDDGKVTAGARAALFVRGSLTSRYRLSLRLDSEENDRARLFRDIRPDELYPVYGDASLKEFDAQSTSRAFVRIEDGASILSYGDFNTGLGSYGQAGSRVLGEYSRTLTGALHRFESRRAAVTAFASRDRLTQVVDVIRGAGISGPYALSRTDGLINSERVELVTRDRSQPAVVVSAERLQRFLDYTIEPLTGRILFRRPIPSVDSELNPIEIRISYEVETGGDEFWVFGGNAQLRAVDRVEIGGGWVRDDHPISRFELASVNATLDLGRGTYLTGEFARTDSARVSAGDGARLELRHASDDIAGRLFFLQTDESFHNASSGLGRGRRELGFLGAVRLGESSRLFGEALRTQDRLSGGRRDGGRVGLERAFGEWVRGQLAFRYADETSTPATPESGETPNETRAIGIRLTARPPWFERGSVFGEFEQDVAESDQRRAAVGGDVRIVEGIRLYARHEFLNSLTGPFGLNPEQEQNATILGIAADNRAGQAVFSEYRVRDAISGREAQAAIGLRNSWLVRDGVRVSTSVERLSPLGAAGSTATALTGALELTGSSRWKGSARGEYRATDGADNLFGSIGYARSLSRDLSFLGSAVFSTLLDGGRAFSRTRLGIAYRETDRNRWNALARYEHRYEHNPEAPAVEATRWAHLLSAHLNYQPDPGLILRTQWVSKFAREESNDISTSDNAHLLSGRGTIDLTSWLDAGVLGRTIFSGSGAGTQFGLGAEIGLLLNDNLRLAGGYNVFGFRDRDLSTEEYTDRGFYVQLGFKFDEGLFSRAADAAQCPAAQACPCPCPGREPRETPPPVPPDTSRADRPELDLSVAGPERVFAGDTIVIAISTRNTGRGRADSLVLRASLPETAVFIRGSRGASRTERDVIWPVLPTLSGMATRIDTLIVRVPVPPVPRPPSDSLAIDARITSSTVDRRARFARRIEAGSCADPRVAADPACLPPPLPPRQPDSLADVEINIAQAGVRGRNLTYVITTRNRGVRDADSVRIEAVLPDRVTVVRASRGGRLDGRVLWPAISRLTGQGGSQRDTLVVRVPAARDTLSIRAFARTSTPEGDTTNNRSVRTVHIILQDTVIIRDTVVLRDTTLVPDTVTVLDTLVVVDTVPVPGPGPLPPDGGWPWLPWALSALLVLIVIYLYLRWRRYGSVFASCWRLWPVFRRGQIAGLVAELRDPGNRRFDRVRAIHERIGHNTCADWPVLTGLFLAYRDVGAWAQMFALFLALPPRLARRSEIRRQYAFALNRAGRSEEAEWVLRNLIVEDGPSAETNGILGRVYKDRFAAAWACGPSSARSAQLLDLVIATYLEGHDAEPNNPYPGLNALMLMEFHVLPPARRASLLAEVERAVNANVTRVGDYWAHASRFELAVLAGDESNARAALARAYEADHTAWQLETTLGNQQLIRSARQARGVAIAAWVSELISSLERRVETELKAQQEPHAP